SHSSDSDVEATTGKGSLSLSPLQLSVTRKGTSLSRVLVASAPSKTLRMPARKLLQLLP
ncbi:unnamed protein product, partial [Phaeothamnion confervicola]